MSIKLIFDVVSQSERKDATEITKDAYVIKKIQDPVNPRKTIEVKTLDMTKVATKDKYDESTNFFINKGHAKDLKDKIEAYKTAMLNLVPPEFRSNIKPRP